MVKFHWIRQQKQIHLGNRMIEIRVRVKEGVMANDVINDIMANQDMQDLQKELPAGFQLEMAGE